MNMVSRYSESSTTSSRFTIPDSDFWLRLPLISAISRTLITFGVSGESSNCSGPVSIGPVSFWHRYLMYSLPTINRTPKSRATLTSVSRISAIGLSTRYFIEFPTSYSSPYKDRYIDNSWDTTLGVLTSVFSSINAKLRSAIRHALSTLASSPLNAVRITSISLFVYPSNWPSNFARSSLNTTKVSNVPIYRITVNITTLSRQGVKSTLNWGIGKVDISP